MKTEINNIQDVLEINGTTKTPEFAEFDEAERKKKLADWHWEQIVKAYNKLRDPNYKADWADWNQAKYFPWTNIKKDESQPSGFGFSFTFYFCSGTLTFCSSRLCFASSSDVLTALKIFGQTYIETITL